MLDVINSFFISPFTNFDFMQKALVGLLILSLSSPIVGIFLTLRKMSLSGDAISHAILPGAAIGFLFFGLSVQAMTICSLIAGVVVTLASSLFSRISRSTEDSNLAVFYLISLSLGVLLISISGSQVDLFHFLFGSAFSMNNDNIISLMIISSLTLLVLAIISRPLIIDSMDPLFLASVSRSGSTVHMLFMIVTVMNLVGGLQAIGTLMAVGLMIIPAVSAKFWTVRLHMIVLLSLLTSALAVYLGLVCSFSFNLPCSPCIILMLGMWYIISFIFGMKKGCLWYLIKTKHLEA